MNEVIEEIYSVESGAVGSEDGAEKPQPTPEQVAELIAKDKAIRKEKCIIKINAALEEYNCAFVPRIILQDGLAPKSDLQIIAK